MKTFKTGKLVFFYAIKSMFNNFTTKKNTNKKSLNKTQKSPKRKLLGLLVFCINDNLHYDKAAICFVNLDFKLAALFL